MNPAPSHSDLQMIAIILVAVVLFLVFLWAVYLRLRPLPQPEAPWQPKWPSPPPPREEPAPMWRSETTYYSPVYRTPRWAYRRRR